MSPNTAPLILAAGPARPAVTMHARPGGGGGG